MANEILKTVTQPKRTRKLYDAWNITPAQIKAAFKLAETGDPQRYFEILKHMKKIDGHLNGELQTRKDALLGYTFDVTGEAEDQTLFIKELMKKIYYAFLETILDAGYESFKGMEVNYIVANNKIIPKSFDVLDNRLFKSIKIDQVKNKPESLKDVLLYRDHTDQWVSYAEQPEGKFVFADYSTMSFKNLPIDFTEMGWGASCVLLSIIKYYNMQDWSSFNEKFAMPLVEGIYTQNADQADIDAIENATKNMSSDSSCVHSDATILNIKEANKTGSVTTYESLFERCNSEQSKIIIGIADLSELGPNGSRSAKETQNRVRIEKQISDARFAENVINEQLIKPLLRMNFPSPDMTIALKINIPQAFDAEAESRVMQNLYEIGTKIPETHIQRKFNIPAPADGESVLQKQTGALSGLLGT